MKSIPFGLGWRYHLYTEYLFYLSICSNYQEVIQARRKNIPLKRLDLRNGLTIHMQGPTLFNLTIFREIWQQNIYVKAFKKPSPRIVVDIGAHFGMFSLQAAFLWSDAKIHAYEPEKANFEILRANIEQNGLSHRITAFHEAVCDRQGSVGLYVKNQPESHSIHPTSHGSGTRSISQVQSVKLDDVVRRLPEGQIDLLKVDCEGCEYQIVGSSLQALQSKVKSIVLEYHTHIEGHDAEAELFKPLQKAGFQVSITPKTGTIGFVFARNAALHEERIKSPFLTRE